MGGDVVTPAEKLRAALEERGWTQDELADRAGIARVTVNGYANGRLNIGGKNGPRLARALGLPDDHFYVPNGKRPRVTPQQFLQAVQELADEVRQLQDQQAAFQAQIAAFGDRLADLEQRRDRRG